MSDSSDSTQPEVQPPDDMTVRNPLSEKTADGIPVEDLIRLTRELTQRITNLDRQRLALQLKESRRSIQTNAPITLQQFFTGEIDLDTELAKRYANAPLMSEISLRPKRPAALMDSRRAIAILSSQDGSAQLSFNLDVKVGTVEITFTLLNMMSFVFEIGIIDTTERQRWLDLMRRQSGIALLWTNKRWEEDYVIFVVRENFARLYAFSPKKFEAAARVTPMVLVELLDWMEAFWFPEHEVEIAPPPDPSKHFAGASVSGDYVLTGKIAESPTQIKPPKDKPRVLAEPTPPTEPPASLPEDMPDEGDSDPAAFDW